MGAFFPGRRLGLSHTGPLGLKTAEVLMAIQPASGVIPVELSVTQFQIYREDRMIQIWGHVGDYEVSVWLPLDDPRAKRFLPKDRSRMVKAKKN
jgi:hypothetical protein